MARWITRPEHPLTSRVFVNRLWHQHFGRGIVTSLDNFGQLGMPPTHPELLDWLAVTFVENGWSQKALHRLIVTSSAYRQSSQVQPDHEELDPENELLSRMPMRRISAEEVRDAILLTAGQLDRQPFGPPDPVEVHQDGLVTSERGEAGWRRSIYLRQRRKEMPTLLETFDLPQMNPNCTERKQSNVVSQPLYLLNNGMIHELAGQFALRVAQDAGDPADQVNRAWLLAMGRPPSEEEVSLSLVMITRLTDHWEQEELEGESDVSPAGRALTDYCHVLLNSAEFLYVD